MKPFSRVPASPLAMMIFFTIASHALIAKPPAAPRIEPGLEHAVKWKWSVQANEDGDWGLPVHDIPMLQPESTTTHPHPNPTPPSTYEVKKGDVLVRIAKKFKVSAADLKAHNQLTSDLIHIGQILQIPPPQERRATKATPSKGTDVPAHPPSADIMAQRVFLDRQGFSTGPISDTPTADFHRILQLYQSEHGEVPGVDQISSPSTDYTLRAADFRFIATPKATHSHHPAAPKGQPTPKPTPAPPLNYDEMVSTPFLAYRSPWEFVAERFHCDEAFLRKTNPALGPYPPAGSLFHVPNVTPFEIESVPAKSPQPDPDPAQPVTASITGMSILEIRKSDRLVAAMPFSKARPGLAGRGEWKILNAISRPAMATLQEARVVPVETVSPFYTNPNPKPAQARATLSSPQILPPGPNNPVGILWINLAKGDGTEPLPFGLHGTSLPTEMNTFEGIGGFRVSNWDILRAAKLLPSDTKLQWKP